MARRPRSKPGSDATSGAIAPMEALLVETLPDEPGWQFEPKWDGFRCIARRSGSEVHLDAKSGKPLGRYFPEVVEMIERLPGSDFTIDGELVITEGDTFSFDALQMRLHPAESRIRKLARETPATLILFDMLADDGGADLTERPLTARRAALERLVAKVDNERGVALSPYTLDPAEAGRWLAKAGGAVDGVVAKRLDGPYESGERAMLKIKRMRTADCVVGGFRYGTGSSLVGSLLLGLFGDDGLLHHVGFTSSIATADRPDLTRKLEALRGGPGFTGRAPGGPSRWSTERSAEWEPLRHKLVAEVRFDHVTDDRMRHGAKFLRWRPDKAARQCGFEQLQAGEGPSRLLREMMEAPSRSKRARS